MERLTKRNIQEDKTILYSSRKDCELFRSGINQKLGKIEDLEEHIGVSISDLLTKILGKSIYYLDDDSYGSCRAMGIELATENETIFSFTSTIPNYYDYIVITDSCWRFRLRDFDKVWFLNEEQVEKALEEIKNEETKM